MNNKHALFLPISTLVSNAFVWGVIWWPLKELRAEGWHALWSTTAIFFLSTLALVLFKPRSVAYLRRAPMLWVIAVTAGVTNGAFNWGMAIGDVVRVILLFYLMPIWAVLFARLLLDEPVTRLAVFRIVLALTGAALVLQPEGGGMPVPSSLADWLGVAGGIAFALNNVMIRRESAQPLDGRALAMFLGAFLIPGLVAVGLSATTTITLPTSFDTHALLLVLGVGVAMFAANIALQYGVAKLPANVTAVVMLIEVVFAALSVVVITGSELEPSTMAGGALILAASGLAALAGRNRRSAAREAPLAPHTGAP